MATRQYIAALDGATIINYPADGGADTLTDLSGSNIMIGGFGNDTIQAGSGNDVILGDNGIVGLGDAALGTEKYNVWTTDYANGGADTIDAGDGNNIVLGGSGADTVTAGSGWDIILGDNGKVVRNADLHADLDRKSDRRYQCRQ